MGEGRSSGVTHTAHARCPGQGTGAREEEGGWDGGVQREYPGMGGEKGWNP
jgi:hypothetical protein